MLEPAVTLTDFGLSLECIVLAVFLARKRTASQVLRRGCVVLFASIGIAAASGGIFHGFVLNPHGLSAALFWVVSLIALGVTALAAWIIGAGIVWPGQRVAWVIGLASVQFVVYVFVILVVSAEYWIAVANYAPAALFLLVVWFLAFRRSTQPATGIGLVGLVLTFVAAAVQVGEVALHPQYFDHNALYHLIQAVALFLIYWGARHLLNNFF